MIAWYVLLGALAVLVCLLLFGFASCSSFGAAPNPEPPPAAPPPPPPPGSPPPPPPPDYGQYGNWVTRTKDLVAYWRLGEPASTPVLKASDPIPAGAVKTAKDTFNGYDGYYLKLNKAATPDYPRHSAATAGDIILGVTPGLLEVAPQENYPCLQVDGGFVQVPWDNHLNPQAFTLESSGPAGLVPKKTGWGLYLGPDQAGNLAWQVWMGDGKATNPKFNQVAVANPGRTQLTLTYLALTYDGAQNLQLWLYYPNTNQDLGLLDVPVLKLVTTPFIFHPNDSSANGKGEFIIGAGSNLFPVIGNPPQRLYPFKGKIQEVALYKSDLSAGGGVQSILASHELAGGGI
jgi:hypothetical protein